MINQKNYIFEIYKKHFSIKMKIPNKFKYDIFFSN